jgi:hypothetical protein
MKASIPEGGLPGQALRYVLATEFADGRKSLPTGEPGVYCVRTLVRPESPDHDPWNIDCTPDLIGDSHILVPKEGNRTDDGEFSHVMIFQDTPDGHFVFKGLPNTKGRLGLLSCDVTAAGHRDAEAKAYRALASALSSFSAQLDIPVRVGRVMTEEKATNSYEVNHRNGYPDVPLAIEAAGRMEGEFRGFAAIYREALNSNSPAYQYLCLFKIIEAIQERRARRIAEGLLPKGQVFPYERFPAVASEVVPFLNAIFFPLRPIDELAIASICAPETAGKKFYNLIETHLLPLRVDIAHALVEAGGITLSGDEVLHLNRVEKWLPVAKIVARRMAKNEFPREFLPFLGEDGIVRYDPAKTEEAIAVAERVSGLRRA